MAKNKQKFNYKTADEVARMRFLTRQQQTAALQSQAQAQDIAQGVKSLGMAAAAGGQYDDTSFRPGFQNPETAQATGMAMRTITRPMNRLVKDVNYLARLRGNKLYRGALVKDSASGSGIYRGGVGGTTPTGTGTYQIL